MHALLQLKIDVDDDDDDDDDDAGDEIPVEAGRQCRQGGAESCKLLQISVVKLSLDLGQLLLVDHSNCSEWILLHSFFASESELFHHSQSDLDGMDGAVGHPMTILSGQCRENRDGFLLVAELLSCVRCSHPEHILFVLYFF